MDITPENPFPELIFALVAPIGVDLEMVSQALEMSLREMRYTPHILHLTKLLEDAKPNDKPTSFIESYTHRIERANQLRAEVGNDVMARVAINAVRSYRGKIRSSASPADLPEELVVGPREKPVPSTAFIIRQLKRPEELQLLRRVYGRQYFTISCFAGREQRLKTIEGREYHDRAGLITQQDARAAAERLVDQDAKEDHNGSGQNVRDSFQLGDVFIDATSQVSCETTIRRFIHLLFGNNQITPSHDEYGMYLAKSASLRSSDLSRQVGAAVFRPSGEVLTVGCNEVPKAGGGTYWEHDPTDARDFKRGFDPNHQRKFEVLVDLLHRMIEAQCISEKYTAKDAKELASILVETSTVADAQVMDLLEFGRIIHAEMSAICDAARRGYALSDAVLYCTTFPCHICAKHIVASGIARVVYLEPYPKSYASELHDDSICVEDQVSLGRVVFFPFIGIAPRRYGEMFQRGKRKDELGKAQPWSQTNPPRMPMIEASHPSYYVAELAQAYEPKVADANDAAVMEQPLASAD